MQIHPSIETYSGPPPVLTMGTFDGVHPGHLALLRELVRLAKALNTVSLVLTFWPHPRLVLGHDPEKLRLLNTLKEKTRILSETGVDHLVVLPFTTELARLSASEFTTRILAEQLKTRHLLVGFNHRFGKDGVRSEELDALATRLGFGLSRYQAVEIDGQRPSSTRIRQLLLEGRIPEANALLGYAYSITGRVVGGQQLGRRLSYPTANLQVNERAKLLPPDGVYACRVRITGKTFGGMVNIGVKPTVNTQMDHRSVEVHILDFKEDIYSEEISLEFLHKTREEMKFEGLEALKTQLGKDETEIRKLLQKHGLPT